MKVSFDGMRRSATSSMNEFSRKLKSILDEERIDEDVKEELIEAFNETAHYIDIFNCIYDDSVEDDMNDLSDEIEINRIELEES